ncbi:MAG: S8 family peptidase [Patescibacteria group bacterium]
MRKILSLFMVFSVVLGLPIAVFADFSSGKTERKIVVFKSGVNESVKDNLIIKHKGIKVKDSGHNKNLKVVNLTDKEGYNLAKNPEVLRVDDDILISINHKESVSGKYKSKVVSQPAQVLPWGIDKIDAELSWATSEGVGINVAVLDTGIDLTHPDLKANIKGKFNAINSRKSATDDNGHGTHVAGIIGALDNSIGVVGVAPEVSLYAVKVLDSRGSGYLSDIIEGIDWSIANGINVINMSFGTNSNIGSFADAVGRAVDKGIVLVAAAGNDGGAVDYPGAYDGVIAVSATDSSDTITSWSSRGPEVSLAAPGLNILSTWKGSIYKTISGTSMASPHVAGSVASIMASPVDPLYDLNTNSIWDAGEVRSKIQDKSTDLGDTGFDNSYGFGLVNLFNSLSL